MAEIPGPFSVLDLPGLEQVEAVGRGGFATVYRGRQQALNRLVAVKVLDRDPGGSTTARFEREARALGSLSGHPNVVAVYEAGMLGDHPYLVMPYLDGGSLEDRLRVRPLGPAAAAGILASVADAVAAAHRMGILHRDIKPANILFTAYGEPQLADFGIARFADSTLTGGLVAATVAYAAPEVLGGEKASGAADIYSLGATLFAALTGRPPFEARPGETPIAFAVRVFSEPAPDVRAAGVPSGVAAVAARAMAKKPGDRYPSAEVFAAELRRAATAAAAVPAETAAFPAGAVGGPVQPTSVAPVAPARRPTKRVTVAVAALVLLAGGGAGAAAELGGHSSPRARTAAPSTTVPAPPTTVAPATAPPTTAPAPGATLTGALPPSAGGVTSPSALPPSTLTSVADAYYSLVNQHRLDESWNWLAPSFQDRIGVAYYHSFWNGIRSVQVLSVSPRPGAAILMLRYVEQNGTVSNEANTIGFTIDPASDRILITQAPG